MRETTVHKCQEHIAEQQSDKDHRPGEGVVVALLHAPVTDAQACRGDGKPLHNADAELAKAQESAAHSSRWSFHGTRFHRFIFIDDGAGGTHDQLEKDHMYR